MAAAAAASSDESVEIARKEYIGTTWHAFSFKFAVLHLDDLQSWTFHEEFDTDCPGMPTSWMCKMVFAKAPITAIVNLPFSLKRTDSSDDPVKLRVSLHICDAIGTHLFNTEERLEIESICGGGEIEKELTEILPSIERVEFYEMKLFVYLIVEILSCHTVTWENKTTPEL
ncbi:hypothetical protein AVEN_173723-1 [Araneus ventricosus]|uniref:MATH domain-containing protein n=1 Tax=Araneus ventricosus TaxID=182803 RepID=A0A4Y2V6N1_ARAVE|nr:hypothetical protein AVEN_173723-1 [Araneus ventricosus]